MNVVRARRIVSSRKRGSSWPLVADTEEGLLLVKLRGAAQGTAALVAEIVVAELADALSMRVPRRTLVTLSADIPSDDGDPELRELLAASDGLNLGFRFLEGAREIRPEEAAAAPDDLAMPALWLDGLVMNPDRTTKNPNILAAEHAFWLIDHGAALGFQYDWKAVTENAPRAPYAIDRHLFASRSALLPEWDERLAPRLSRETVTRAVDAVPDDFLIPLLGRAATPDRVRRRRAGYQAFLWKRLKPPRPFVP
jgi:hypothetical protein